MNADLRNYVESEIIPRYASFDEAHREDHARTVIEQSLALAEHYDVDRDMVYAIAAFHDTGLCEGRERHHLVSGQIIRQDARLKEWFSPAQIETMAQAAEDHRASSDHEPRSIYGRIVAEADRIIDSETIVRRALQYGLKHEPGLDREGQYSRLMEHMREKYDYGGYLKLWIPQGDNARRLEQFRRLLHDEAAFRQLFDKIFNSLSIN